MCFMTSSSGLYEYDHLPLLLAMFPLDPRVHPQQARYKSMYFLVWPTQRNKPRRPEAFTASIAGANTQTCLLSWTPQQGSLHPKENQQPCSPPSSDLG